MYQYFTKWFLKLAEIFSQWIQLVNRIGSYWHNFVPIHHCVQMRDLTQNGIAFFPLSSTKQCYGDCYTKSFSLHLYEFSNRKLNVSKLIHIDKFIYVGHYVSIPHKRVFETVWFNQAVIETFRGRLHSCSDLFKCLKITAYYKLYIPKWLFSFNNRTRFHETVCPYWYYKIAA